MTLVVEAPPPVLTLQEEALATAMLHQVGSATVNFAMRDGVRLHQNGSFGANDFNSLAAEFGQEPKDSLAWARESLFAITEDERLSPGQRSERLGRYLDAYFDLTIKLDHAAFPPTAKGEVRAGVPNYIPDGFVDMGGDRNPNPAVRNRDMVVVDKREMFDRYRGVLLSVFEKAKKLHPHDSDKQKLFMINEVAQAVYFQLPYNHGEDKNGDYVRLSQMPAGVCRHQALTAQVLLQALGITSRLAKTDVKFEGNDRFGRHAANLVRVNHQWGLLDVTAPEHEVKDDKNVWRAALYKINDLPSRGQPRKQYDVKGKFTGQHHSYKVHQDDMHWMVQ